MKIVHIDETFHPSYGYQVNPLAKFQSKAGHDVYIVTVSKDKLYPVYKEFGDNGDNLELYDEMYTKDSGVKIIRVPVSRYISNRAIYKNELFRVLDDLKPDIVFAHLVESYASIRLLLMKKNFPIVFDSHMLAMASKNKFAMIYEAFYKKILSPIIKKNKHIVIRTQDDDYIISHLGIPVTQAPFISFGTDTSIFRPDEEVKMEFRKKHNISNEDFVVIYTGKLSEAKGALFLANAIRDKFNPKNNKNVVFIIVGNSVDSYGDEVEQVFSNSQNKIIRFPSQKYTDLPTFYQSADLSIFPKQCSLSFYDAQACGLPVVSEDNSINYDRLRHGNGFNFNAGNIEDFRRKILDSVEMDNNEFEKMKMNSYLYIKENFDYKTIAEQYTEILIEEYNRFYGINNNGKDI
jgi:glycosyltransferase involved in cell wall biosynthesis